MIFLHLVAKHFRHKDTKKDFSKQLFFVPLSLCGNFSGLSGDSIKIPVVFKLYPVPGGQRLQKDPQVSALFDHRLRKSVRSIHTSQNIGVISRNRTFIFTKMDGLANFAFYLIFNLITFIFR